MKEVLKDFKEVSRTTFTERYRNKVISTYMSYNTDKMDNINKLIEKELDKEGYNICGVSKIEDYLIHPNQTKTIYFDYDENYNLYLVDSLIKAKDSKVKISLLITLVEAEDEVVYLKDYETDLLVYDFGKSEILYENIDFILDNQDVIASLDRDDKRSILNILFSIFKDKDLDLYEHFNEGILLIDNINSRNINLALFSNMANLVIKEFDSFEKLIKTESSFLKTSISKDLIIVGEGSKIKNIIGLPKQVIDRLNDLGIPESILTFQKLSQEGNYDGNDLVLIVDFIEILAGGKSLKDSAKDYRTKSILETLSEILLLEDFKVKQLLENIIKNATFVNVLSIKKQSIQQGLMISIMDITTLFKDYLKMCKQNNVEAIKYPSNIVREHNTIMKNLKIKVKEEDLKVAVEAYEGMIDSFKSNSYTLTLPYTKEDLITEGLTLHHCVTSYAKDIVKGSSKIFFLRNITKKEEPFVTIEVSKDNKLNHIKGKYNLDPEKDIIDMVNDWLENYSLKEDL